MRTLEPSWRRSAFAGVVLALGLAGCGSGSSDDSGSDTDGAPPTEKPLVRLTGPAAETGILEPDVPLTWQSSDEVSMYLVDVGTVPGGDDIYTSGESAAVSVRIPPAFAARVPADATVHVRLSFRVAEQWDHVDYALQWRAKSLLLFPLDADDNVDVASIRFLWNAITNAEAYRLSIGTTPGGGDVADSGESGQREFRIPMLPGGRSLHARLQTKVGGEWRHTDSAFMTRPAATFVYPRHGQVGVTLDRDFEWNAVAGAERYRIELGTHPGSDDLYSSPEVTETRIGPPTLPAAGPVYGRLWTLTKGTWRHTNAIFTLAAEADAATMSWPRGSNDVAVRDGLRWEGSPLALGYRLMIGGSPGGAELHDSGRIRTVRRLVEGLPTSVELYGTLQTVFIDGKVEAHSFTFKVTDSSLAFADRWNLALWATGEVRRMADWSNIAFPNTLLIDEAQVARTDSTLCTAYARALMALSRAANLGLQARQLQVCLNPNGYDCHALVEVQQPDDSRWVILDPTFGLTARRLTDGANADATDIHASMRDRAFDDIVYEYVTDAGPQHALGYYIDYPLLYGQILLPNANREYLLTTDSILPFFETLASRTASEPGHYAVRCLDSRAEVNVLIDGDDSALSCNPGIDNISKMFWADSVEPVDDEVTYDLLQLSRFVFD